MYAKLFFVVLSVFFTNQVTNVVTEVVPFANQVTISLFQFVEI